MNLKTDNHFLFNPSFYIYSLKYLIKFLCTLVNCIYLSFFALIDSIHVQISIKLSIIKNE